MAETKQKTSKFSIPSLLEMLKAGVHFGHLTSKWHPKTEPFIFSARQGVHIINLEVTQKQLEKALQFVADTVANGGTILFVGTKKQVQNTIKKHASSVGMPYIHERWIGGFLTNFAVIGKMIKRHKELGKNLKDGGYKKLTKKEQLERQREYNRLEDVIGGIATLEKTPDAIFMIDIGREKTACREAKKMGVPIVALCDTNANPQDIAYPIAANDDAVGSLEMMIALVADAVKQGTGRRKTETVAAAAPKEAKSATTKAEK